MAAFSVALSWPAVSAAQEAGSQAGASLRPRFGIFGNVSAGIGGLAPGYGALAGVEVWPLLFGGVAFQRLERFSEDDGFLETHQADAATALVELHPLGDAAFAPHVWVEAGVGWRSFESERAPEQRHSSAGFAWGFGAGLQYRANHWALGPEIAVHEVEETGFGSLQLRLDVRL